MIEITTKPIAKSIEQVDPLLCYGVKCSHWKRKGFVSRLDCNAGQYRIFALSGINKGNCWSQYDDYNLKDCLLKFAEDINGRQIFEFETPKELFTWLAAD